MIFRSISIGIVLAGISASPASAHVLQNMGIEESFDAMPAVRDMSPIADQDIQRMAIDMQSADCNRLAQLDDQVREAFLIMQLFLQREGALSRIVGPTCTFLGPAEKIAEISDPSLTIQSDRESMYYLTDMHVILVSHQARDTIAYGMFYHGEDPVDYFLEHRADAEQSAVMARTFFQTATQAETTYMASSRSSVRLAVPLSSRASQASVGTATSRVSASTASTPALPAEPDNGFIGTPSSLPQAEDTTSAPRNTNDSEAQAMSSVSTEAVPDISPIGPEPPPPEQQSSITLWIVLLVFTVLSVALVAGYLYVRGKHAANTPPTKPEKHQS